jgi:signal transduction histidine kinase
VLEDRGQTVAANLEALERARDELRVLLERLPDLVVVHDGGRVRWANRAFLDALGCEHLAEVLGTSNPLTLAADGALTEVRLETRRGQHRVIEVAPEQEVSLDGVVSRLVVGRDVTEQVAIRARLVLADRLASLGLVAAGVAHEVDAPLESVLESLESACRRISPYGEHARAGQAMLSIALEGVDRMRVIVRDLLLLSRGDETPAVPIDVVAVTTATLALAAPEIARTATLVRDFAPVPRVRANEARISQILLNLVSNSLEAMEGRTTKGELAVRIAPVENGVLLEVRDTGRGISSADLPHVFEPFFTTNAGGRGTGLGLAIAQRLVVQLGGEIRVASTSSQGTTFHVTLPVAGASATN